MATTFPRTRPWLPQGRLPRWALPGLGALLILRAGEGEYSAGLIGNRSSAPTYQTDIVTPEGRCA